MLEIFIVEDDADARDALINHFKTYPCFSVTGFSDNSEDALRKIKQIKPQAVILDLELKRGAGDGLDFLKKLRAENGGVYVVVTTNNVSRITHRAARALGCDYIFTKCEGDYSPKKVADLLSNVQQLIGGKGERPESKKSKNSDGKILRRRIHYELTAIGVSHKLCGYGYLTDAIAMAYNGETGFFCQRVAKQRHKSEQSVERAMQNAINRAWNTGDPNELCRIYTARVNSEKGAPTVNEFIYFFAQKLQDYD